MHPILFRYGITIHTFGPLVALGSFLAILYIRREGLRRLFDPEVLTGLAVEVLLAGVIGSRILFIAITPEAFEKRPDASWIYNNVIQYLALWNGGLVWYGGLIPAAIFAIWRARKLGLPFRTVADILAPAVMLGLAVGRVGCLMAGDDHGKLVPDGPHWWTLTFTDPEALVAPHLRGKPLWPSQPLMGIGAFTIFLVCHALRKKFETRPGALTLVMMTLYPIHRFLVEFTRGDSVRKFLVVWETDPRTKEPVSGLSTSQSISIPLAALMLFLLLLKLRKPAEGIERATGEGALKDAEGKPVAETVAAVPAGAPAPGATPPS